jgi:uncharacterized membrane protein YbhN (UPF0104 family)
LFWRFVSVAFLALVLGAIVAYARSVDWQPVGEALRAYRPATLALAALAAAASCLVYASFDLLTRPHAGAGLSWRWIVPVAFTSYTFNMNLGPWIGGFGIRLRQYAKLGIGAAQTLRVLAVSVITNWSGFVLLAGLVFAIRPPLALPPEWPVGAGALRAAGVALLMVTASYWAACAWARRRVYSIYKLSLRLPPLRTAVAQAGLAAGNWMLIATVPWILLGGAAGYPAVLATMLLAAVAGAVLHVPGGVGVIEAVVLSVLGREVPHGPLVAALLVYRATYYLWPFVLGVATFAVMEHLLRRREGQA